jgi:transglutaminase-like putative cysteine protease
MKVITPVSSFDKELEKKDNTMLSWGLRENILKKGFRPGTKYSYNMLFPEKFEFLEVTTEVVSSEVVDFAGKKLNLHKLKTVINEMKLVKFDYLDDAGVCYISEIPTIGMKFVKTSESKVSEEDLKTSFNLSEFYIKPVGEVDKLSNVYSDKECQLFITANNIDLHDLLLSNKRQTVEYTSNNKAKVILRSTENKKPEISLNRPFKKEDWLKSSKKIDEKAELLNIDFAQYLTDSPFIQSKDKRIKKKALEIVGNEKNIFICSKLLCKWVNENLKNKNYKNVYASALEVFENLEGDCSEHTLLFIALARSLGIPARGVIGLVYSVTDKAYAFHVWGEVFTGEWIEMDPTFGFDYVTPAHFPVVTTNMNDLAFSAETIKLLQIIRDFKIEIL